MIASHPTDDFSAFPQQERDKDTQPDVRAPQPPTCNQKVSKMVSLQLGDINKSLQDHNRGFLYCIS
jgi:hypothetical protein